MFVCLFLLTLWWIGYLSKVNCVSCPVTGESGSLLKNQKGDSLTFGDSLKWPCEELQLFKIHFHLQISNFTIERDVSVQSDTANGCFIKKTQPPPTKMHTCHSNSAQWPRPSFKNTYYFYSKISLSLKAILSLLLIV